MNRSYSKIRHIQESNRLLEKRRLINEFDSDYLFVEDETTDTEQEPQDIDMEEPTDTMDSDMSSDEMENEESPEEMAADRIEEVMDNPKVEDRIERIVDRLSNREKMLIQRGLEEMGITPESSVEDVHQVVQSNMEEISTAEMTEGEEKSDKQKIADFLEGIGGGNMAAWGGVPLAIAIGGTVGSMGVGFAASWGLTGLLYGIAKLLSDKK